MVVKIIISLLLSTFLCQCATKNQEEINFKDTVPFFSYDNVEYYYIPFSEMEIIELLKNKNNSIEDSIKTLIILDKFPKSLNDSLFFQTLTSPYFFHREIPKYEFPLLDSIFIEKT